jgi:regulation of enolase protein 1 (concanavalin A-like superfamily)
MRQRVEYLGVCAIASALVAGGTLAIVRAQSALPAPWITAAIGAPSPAGTSSFSNGRFTVSAGGVDIWNNSDQFRFVYQPVSGDVDIVARIDSLAAADPWSKAGVMIRADLSASSAHAYAIVSGAHGVAFQRRLQPGGISSTTAGEVVSAPRWVRLKRVGAVITGYSSADGGTWQTIGSAMIAIGQSAYVGFAVTSHNPGSAATAVFSQATVTTAAVAAPTALPSGQSTRDIGAPAIAGSVAYAQGVYTVVGAGNDIWDSSDQFRYVYQQVTGDLNVVVRVASVEQVNAWTKAGIMVRESLNANSRHAMALLSAGHGYSFQWRLDNGGPANYVSGGSGSAPAWLRLVRTGFRFEAFRSTNGSSWTSMGVETVPMTDPVYVGLAVTSHKASRAAAAVFDHLTVTSSAPPPNGAPTVSLTAPVSGATFTAPATISLTASASDPENQLSRVEFYRSGTLIGSDTTSPYTASWSSAPAGSYSLTAVAIDAAGNRTTSAAIPITVSSATSTAPRLVVFHASSDHATLVTSYRLDIFANGANPSTATPVATSNLGKPTPDAAGDITVDRASFFAALAPATYQATVSAIGSGGTGRSAPVLFTR